MSSFVQETVRVDASSRSYDVVVGSGILDSVGGRIAESAPCDAAIIVTDTNVAPYYLERVQGSMAQASLHSSSVVLPAGERHKNLGTYGTVLEAMAAASLTRDSVVVALGGGVVGDMAGFAAATYMRGTRVVQLPTTLLSMVDSSVGGKTAVDLSRGKNLVGAFLQPSLVIADVRTLTTLEPDVFVDGLGEVVKHGVLASEAMFESLCAARLLQEGDEALIARIVAQNVAIKRDVVNADEQERGLRQTLNLGHTIGHAIEAASGYSLGHGHCVAAGLCCVARAAESLGWSERGLAHRIETCVRTQGLPTGTDFSIDDLMLQATHDKKRHGATVNIVVPIRIGKVELRTITLAELEEVLRLGCRTNGNAR